MDLEEDLVVVDDDTDIDKSDGNGHRSISMIPAAVGKTPYTMSMELKRGPKGYGFSVTWTHPPRYCKLTGLIFSRSTTPQNCLQTMYVIRLLLLLFTGLKEWKRA